MADQELCHCFGKQFCTILFAFTVLIGRGIPFAHLDFTVYDASIRHAFQVGIQNNLVSARAMQDLYVLDAVMANINTDGLAHATDFRNQS